MTINARMIARIFRIYSTRSAVGMTMRGLLHTTLHQRRV